jgi:hypothetical protein
MLTFHISPECYCIYFHLFVYNILSNVLATVQPGVAPMHSTFFSKSTKSGRGDTSVWTDTPVEKAEKAKMA